MAFSIDDSKASEITLSMECERECDSQSTDTDISIANDTQITSSEKSDELINSSKDLTQCTKNNISAASDTQIIPANEKISKIDASCETIFPVEQFFPDLNQSSKRKHNTLSLDTKLTIIKRMENGESSALLAAQYNVGRATIFDIRHKKEKILNFASKLQNDIPLKSRKTMRHRKRKSSQTENNITDNTKSNKAEDNVKNKTADNQELIPFCQEIKKEVIENNTSASNTIPKRKHHVLTLEDKIEIIEQLEKGVSVSHLATVYNIGRATVFDIRNKKNSLLNFASQLKTNDGVKRRKTMRKANDEALEEAVYMWYAQRLSQGQPVSGPLLCEKALELNRLLSGPPDFKASSGWLKNFKIRRGIKQFSAENQSTSADKQSVDYSYLEAYLNLLQQEGYSRDDIYTADKIEINLKPMPANYMFQSESQNSLKGLESMTVMMCVNSNWSHVLPLVMIGKLKKEKCFKNISCLPVLYRSSENGVLDAELFLEWYANEFISAVKREKNNTRRGGKALLLLHEATFLPDVDALNVIDENFVVMFYPSNLASFFHSIDQVVLKKLKTMFKIQVLSRLLMFTSTEKEENNIEIPKKITLKDFSYMLADTWNSLAEDKMKDEWSKLWRFGEEGDKIESHSNEKELKEIVEMCKSIPNLSKLDREDIRAWLSNDNDTNLDQNDSDPETEVITPLPIDDCFREEEDDETIQKVQTHSEVIKSFETAIEWCEGQKECFPEQLILLKRLKDLAAHKSLRKIQDVASPI